ncbi:MAG: class II aldolase/adducin family protein [Candidatus Thermoplasmatota archaeon]|nr:class II aldolase/adducin family protein [Candidatus Thermoplasmatota archaeon]
MTDEGIENLIRPILDAAREIGSRGWCVGTTGNISLIIDDHLEIWDVDPLRYDTGLFLPSLEGKMLLFSRTGSRIIDIPDEPENNLGLYLVSKWGRHLTLLWGEGPPTSEFLSHLLIYASSGNIKAIVHSHMDEVDRSFSGPSEYPSGLPDRTGWIPELPPGSMDLAEATAREVGGHDIMIWHRHGLVSCGEDLEDCLSKLDRFEEWARSVPEG